jgi:hypothetical protein
MHPNDQFVVRRLGSGLDGYLSRTPTLTTLAAIHSAAHGSLIIGRGAQAKIVAATAAAPRPGAFAALDSRDLEIMELLAQGLPPRRGAERKTLVSLECTWWPTTTGTHCHPNVKAWLAKNPRITMHFTPTSASWMNMVEIFFGRVCCTGR